MRKRINFINILLVFLTISATKLLYAQEPTSAYHKISDSAYVQINLLSSHFTHNRQKKLIGYQDNYYHMIFDQSKAIVIEPIDSLWRLNLLTHEIEFISPNNTKWTISCTEENDVLIRTKSNGDTIMSLLNVAKGIVSDDETSIESIDGKYRIFIPSNDQIYSDIYIISYQPDFKNIYQVEINFGNKQRIIFNPSSSDNKRFLNLNHNNFGNCHLFIVFNSKDRGIENMEMVTIFDYIQSDGILFSSNYSRFKVNPPDFREISYFNEYPDTKNNVYSWKTYLLFEYNRNGKVKTNNIDIHYVK